MGNRKQPFGYRMTLGEITIQPEEADLVRFVFQGYSTGATLGELTKALCRQEIRLCYRYACSGICFRSAAD